ncbi:MAG: hypothetical protein U9Q67_02060, partial [Patescibacteria group bacterium]|nr:hypothetical protein [Patescibacteria group bacterium]
LRTTSEMVRKAEVQKRLITQHLDDFGESLRDLSMQERVQLRKGLYNDLHQTKMTDRVRGILDDFNNYIDTCSYYYSL